ncbi:ABC transporter E family member 2-like isoform X3 [Panicum virgatum]|uniref:ABC transporter E family member 2-like isoform X3 n=1 Tax=Panicum virgatum TaxID=38727 RepID=UPI0019D53A62|nr:ABC transporter E family member 2-like isoform X3 [Panicum virgatum]
MVQRLSRVAVVEEDRCKPKKCGQECKRNCPVVKIGKHCIEVGPKSKSALISEELCIGCGICVKKCPFGAITIINLPKDLDRDTTHRFGPNSFKLHRLPVPRPGQVLGLVGINGIGKSTALNILAGAIKPNLGRFNNPPDWHEILAYFHGSELQNYFKRMVENNLKPIMKPQVEIIHKNRNSCRGIVGQLLDRKDERGTKDQLCNELQLSEIIDREVAKLSGGELQRVGIAAAALQSAEIYMFDEPSSYLDVRQRLNAARVIKSLLRTNSYVIVVEHDLSVLDYMSDYVCCLYGKPGAYGVVTLPFSVREGVNIFLAGFIPTENLRFRDESLTFKIVDAQEDAEIKTYQQYKYPTMSKTIGNFKLTVVEGEFTDSQIVVMLGENGTGKTTFIRMLAGVEKPDTVDGVDIEVPEFYVSYKPQKIALTYPGSSAFIMWTATEGSNMCLSRKEQRIVASKVIKRFVLHANKTAFIVEHDFIMATYLADKVIVYEGQPAIDCTANSPQSLLSGMNKFLSHLDITFRRDPTNFRPRINKLESAKDREQKSVGSYYYL